MATSEHTPPASADASASAHPPADTGRAARVGRWALGLGFGGYIAVEQALVSQVLPTATARGKDLGILNIANSAPQVLGPAVAAVLVTQLGGYPALYLATAAVTIGGSLLVLKVRSVA